MRVFAFSLPPNGGMAPTSTSGAFGVPVVDLVPEAAHVIGEVMPECVAEDPIQVCQRLRALDLDAPPQPGPIFQRSLETIDLLALRLGDRRRFWFHLFAAHDLIDGRVELGIPDFVVGQLHPAVPLDDRGPGIAGIAAGIRHAGVGLGNRIGAVHALEQDASSNA